MPNLSDCLVIFWLCAFATALPASHAGELPPSVLANLAQAGIPPDATGVYVREVERGQTLISHNAASALNPASTMKLVTSYAALELLGPAYTWKTQAYETGVRRGDVLYGDLILRGSGAPDLTLQQVWMFLRELRARGVRDIRGRLLFDRSMFAAVPFDAAAFDDDPSRPYNAGPDALLLNYRALRLRLTPLTSSGKVAVDMDPPLHAISVHPPTLAAGPCVEWRKGLELRMEPEAIHIDGSYPAACGEQDWVLYAYGLNANRYADALLRRMWTDLGGLLHGEALDGAVPAGARMVVEAESAALPQIVRDINKFSNNVMARQLLLTLAAEISKAPATVEQGGAIIHRWLQGKHIPAHELVIENGAGLSRTERISANTLGQLLVAAFHSPVMPEFMASLPLVGQDGTMRQRLKQAGVAGYAHVKSGALRDVRAIAGYVLAASGKRYAVVFLINHADAARGSRAQDALLQWVHEQG